MIIFYKNRIWDLNMGYFWRWVDLFKVEIEIYVVSIMEIMLRNIKILRT
jgi:hypothetical protein